MDSLQECVSTAVSWLERQSDRFGHPALRTALQAARGQQARGRSPAFMLGSFSGHEIAHVMEHLAGTQVAGTLTVSSLSWWAILWFDGGRIVHAESPQHHGRSAVRGVMNLTDGWYVFLSGPLSADIPRTLSATGSVTGLLLDILRELDEQRADRRPSAEPAGTRGVEAVRLDLSLGDLLEIRKVADGLRDAHMTRRRAELDAWFYRESPTRAERYREAEARAEARLFQWLASRSAFPVLDALRVADSAQRRLELLDDLITRAGEQSLAGPGEANEGDLAAGEAAWSALEEEE